MRKRAWTTTTAAAHRAMAWATSSSCTSPMRAAGAALSAVKTISHPTPEMAVCSEAGISPAVSARLKQGDGACRQGRQGRGERDQEHARRPAFLVGRLGAVHHLHHRRFLGFVQARCLGLLRKERKERFVVLEIALSAEVLQ